MKKQQRKVIDYSIVAQTHCRPARAISGVHNRGSLRLRSVERGFGAQSRANQSSTKTGNFMDVTKVHAAVVAALAGVGSFGIETAALAQEGLEEIVVTATRREQNLQEVPISIIAITGDKMEARGIDNLEEVSQGVPNIVISGGGGGTGGTRFRMRGIPNVGTYIDGVWQIAGTGGLLTQEFVDIDRIEVLRGPQGTNFGRDSVGGAIRLWTKRPGDERGGQITATTGSNDRRDVKASIDLPFGDNVKTKWTGANLTRDGYIHSLTTGENGGGVDQQVFRGDIVWDATDKLDFRFNYQKDSNEFTEPRVQDMMFNTFQDPAPAWVKQAIGLPQFYDLVGIDAQGNPVEPFFDPARSVAGYPGGLVGKWQNRSNIDLPNSYDTDQVSVETNWQFSENMKLQFLTANTKQDSNTVIDYDNNQYHLVEDINRSKIDVFSQEIQLTGGRGKVDWLAGAFYWDQKVNVRNARWQVLEFRYGQFDVNRVFNSPQCTNVPAGYTTCQALYASAIAPGASYDQLREDGQDGWAAFGEVTIHFTDTLDLTLGLRHHEQDVYSQLLQAIPGVTAPKPLYPDRFHPSGDPFAGVAVVAPNRSSHQRNTPKAALTKQFSDNIMGYVSYSEGYVAGGVSNIQLPSGPQQIPFADATLENVEVGMRSDLLDGQLRFNWTLFNTTWANLHANGVVYDPVTGVQALTLVTTNVGEAEAKGVEFEVNYLPTENLLLSLGLGLLDTAYTRLNPGTMTGHLPLTTGTEFALAPDKSYTLGIEHTASLSGGGRLISRLDYNYQGQFWRDEPFLRASGYAAVPNGYDESGDWGVLNLRFTYEPADATWSASVFGTNLTDEYMINSGFFHGVWGYDFATVGRPREVGASLTYRF
jgi:iron complex outermembrane receptor protein